MNQTMPYTDKPRVVKYKRCKRNEMPVMPTLWDLYFSLLDCRDKEIEYDKKIALERKNNRERQDKYRAKYKAKMEAKNG